MATLNTVLSVVCDDSTKYQKLLAALEAGTVPDVVSYTTSPESLTINVTIQAAMFIP